MERDKKLYKRNQSTDGRYRHVFAPTPLSDEYGTYTYDTVDNRYTITYTDKRRMTQRQECFKFQFDNLWADAEDL